VFEGDPFITPQFRAQALLPFGPVVIVEPRTSSNGGLEVSHDILVR
jgi:hypothetical protein